MDNKNDFYVHANKPTKRVRIHLASCGHCKSGNGQDKIKGDKNSQWAGPFKNYEDAKNYAISLKKPDTADCPFCI